MKILAFALLTLVFTSQANVDMVMGDAAQNELLISWSRYNSAFLGKYSGGAYTDVVEHQNLNSAEVTLAFDENESAHVLFLPYIQGEYGDFAHILTYSYDDLTYQSTFQVENMAMHDRFGLLKTPDERWDALLAYSNVAFTSTTVELCAEQTSFDISSSGELTVLDSAWWYKTYYYLGDAGIISEYPAIMVGPVVCPGGCPLIATSFGYDGSIQGWLMVHSLIFDPDSAELQCHTIGEFWNPIDSGVLGLGCSSDTEAILLFSDSLGEMNWSLYNTLTPEPESTDIFPWSVPVNNDPVAFTSAGSLPGILMVWYRDGEIRCRHWNGEWNSFDYHVTNSAFPPGLEDIAVCADTDGYWVAWLPTNESEPQVIFIGSDEVTGIQDQTSDLVDPVVLRSLSNPSTGLLSVEILGVDTGTVMVLDMAGRVVLQSGPLRNGVHALGELPAPGVYLIRLTHSSGTVTSRVVCI